jgi:hypothetical protein
LSSDIDSLADVDNATISLDTATNTIRLKEAIAAPASGMYTFNSNVEVSDTLTVGGVDVMAEISSEISARIAGDESLETALSTEVSYLIANTDLTSIDSFAEVSDAVTSVETSVNNLSDNTGNYILEMMPRVHSVNETPDGTIVSFTAEVIGGTAMVFLNGLMQTPGEDYEGTYVGHLSSFTFDFYSAPAATDRIEVYGVHYGHTFGGVN